MSHILQERTVRSIPELLQFRAEETPNGAAFRYPDGGGWHTVTWRELHDRIRKVAGGLRALGVENEDRVALLCSTRYEWVVADLAILAAGAATTTVYPSNTADECAFIITDSDSRVVIVENEDQYNKIAEVRDQLHDDTKLVLIEGSIEGVPTLDDLAEQGADSVDEIDAIVDSIGPDNLATLIYTSGTTGRPKGVELTQDNWLYAAEGSSRLDILRSDDLHFLWLPLSHSMGKVLEILMIDAGVETAIDGRVDKIVENLAEIRPTLMAAAPRIFEKVHNVAVSSVSAEGGAKAAIFNWAVRVGATASQRKAEGKMGRALALEHKIADRLVFAKLRDRFGGRIRYFISGSAPLSQDLIEFFDAAGLTVLEGYGLTESAASTFVNPPDKPKFGTVGPPLPGTEVKIAEDGEILLRSRGIMRGYHGLPDETAQTLQDGWLYTGDIGELDDENYLRITDRKKELIKTSGGKYVAPTKIEGLIKSASPYISNALVHGDRRKYCVALVTLDPDAVGHWAEEQGVENDPAVIAEHPEMIKLVEAAVDKANSELASYESIKKVAILPAEFAVETGELTPSMKIKRRVVEQQNMDVLDSMYADA
jgi:long-chain acyl-CoA synthetase